MTNKLNTRLFKRVVKLPNVSEFVALKTGLHDYALMYGIEKAVRITKAVKLVESDRANKYLVNQAKRLSRYAANREMEKFACLSRLMLERSVTFRLLALNHVLPEWFLLKRHKLKGLWNRLSKLCWTLTSNLNYKRVWIDKKPNDYARPLGVPVVEWRAFSYMRMDHLERGFKALGMIRPFQHGGRSGVGVLSAWAALIPRLKESRYIYEFDLKGFFDNVNHSAILRLVEPFGTELYYWIKGILKKGPKSYVMPPENKDAALQALKAQTLPKPTGIFTDWKVTEDHGVQSLGQGYQKILKGIPLEVNLEDLSEEDVDFYFRRKAVRVYQEYKVKLLNGGSMLVGEPMDLERYILSEKEAHANTNNVITDVYVDKAEPLWREKARDSWKQLGIPGKGVPQGLGTSPLLSTILTDTYLKSIEDNLLMYMDDGLIFAETRTELDGVLTRMKTLLKSFGVEIEPKKSGMIKEGGKWIKSSRFLGLRYDPEKDTIFSDTRSGTQMEFPARKSWEEISEIIKINNMNISVAKRKFDNLLHLKAYEAGLKHGFLGCLISESQYKELRTLDERRMDILTGQLRSWTKIRESDKTAVITDNDMIEVKLNLTNASSISVYKFLRFLKLRRKFGWR